LIVLLVEYVDTCNLSAKKLNPENIHLNLEMLYIQKENFLFTCFTSLFLLKVLDQTAHPLNERLHAAPRFVDKDDLGGLLSPRLYLT